MILGATTRLTGILRGIVSGGTGTSVLFSTSVALLFACIISVFGTAFAPEASAKTRSLKLYYLHTGERAEITYKRNGKYIKSGLKKINRFLRDWRRNEPTKMDPRLLDLVWEVYRESGSRKHIHVISGYRSPKTNNMLRKRGRGVASKSQHTYGKALDFYLPDVKLSKLRRIGLIKQAGGVGYYPKSGSPFVHLDTGRVRHWPRMSRSQLARVFPNGKTLHVPSDGKPLKGFNIAKARYEKRKRGQSRIVISEEKQLPKKPKPAKPNFFQRLVSNDEKEDKESVTTPAPKPVKTTVEKPIERKENDAPEQPEEELVVASLPETVPVPLVAPRAELELVVENPEPVIKPVVEPEIRTEPQIVVAEVNEPVIEVPVPVTLANPVTPTAQSAIPVAESRSVSLTPDPRPVDAFDEETSNLLALADPSQEPTRLRDAVDTAVVPTPVVRAPSNNVENAPKALASLSPVQIQDIRKRLRNTYGSPNAPRPGIAIPRPSGPIGAEGESNTVLASFDRFAPIKQNVALDSIRREPIEFERDNQDIAAENTAESRVVATLAPSLRPDTNELQIGIPSQKPIVESVPAKTRSVEIQETQTEIASLDPNASRISASNEVLTNGADSGNAGLLAELRRLVSERKKAQSVQDPVEPELVKTGVPALPSENPARLALANLIKSGEKQEDPAFVVSLLPDESDAEINERLVAPEVNPVRAAQEDESDFQVASLSPIEPGVVSSNRIALPTSNPERFSKRIEILEKLAEQAEQERLAAFEGEDKLSVGSIALIPTPTPRPGLYEESVELASLRDDLVLDFEEDETETQAAVLPRINRTLARFNMSDLSDDGIGKFALANDRSIKDISDIRPPAYGRNAILELPSTVLTAGFASNPVKLPTNRFTKRPTQRTAFAKFDK